LFFSFLYDILKRKEVNKQSHICDENEKQKVKGLLLVMSTNKSVDETPEADANHPTLYTKRMFLQHLYDNSDIHPGWIKAVYELMWEETQALMFQGHTVSIMGFGKFSLKRRKGGVVNENFNEANAGGWKLKKSEDYYVVRFEPSRKIRDTIRSMPVDPEEKSDTEE